MAVLFDWSKTISELPGTPVPPEWLETNGKGVKVAFVDTGVNLGLAALKDTVAEDRRFFTGSPDFFVTRLKAKDLVQDSYPETGHGTKYFSLLAGKNATEPTEEDIVLGLANEAEYYIIKARDANDVTTTVRSLLRAFELAANLGIDVVICGLCLSASKIVNELNMSPAEVDRVFALPGVKKLLIFNALENRSTGDPWDEIALQMFPNLRPEVFNIARLPNDIDVLADIIRPQQVSFLAARFEGWSLLTKSGMAETMIDTDSPEAETTLGRSKVFSNSCAVAIIGGIATLACSFFKTQNNGAIPTKAELAALLNTHFSPLGTPISAPDTPSFFTNVNPAEL